MTVRQILVAGALAAAVGVGLGAFGAHGLADRLIGLGYEDELPQRMAWFETGVKYQLYHALGLIVVALLMRQSSRLATLGWVGVAFLLGIGLFSGSLYAMTFLSAEWKKLGAVVPLGGICFLFGWIWLAVGAWRDDGK